ncbi:MAG: hypothetical protein YK1309IOTA_1930008 [Marine Group I thaumarchaeote]|nr:MAG: hypothetical protein YK1309IOTA_1930008 [Marine Group I thaumarchaeote]
MPRWITKNGNRVPIYPKRRRLLRSPTSSTLRPTVTTTSRHRIILRRTVKEPEKKWYEEGWRKELYRFQRSRYAIDVKNFGNNNFSFVVRKGSQEIFTVPKSLLKNAVSCGFALAGIPGCPPGLPLDGIPIDGIIQVIKLYDQLA